MNPHIPGASPYATGGGGVQLEREFAASALASLLLAQPVEGLGDEFTPTRVSMQQRASAPIDDVVIEGHAPGGHRTIRVACRRHPTIGNSDVSTVRLFADFLQVVLAEPSQLAAGQLRMGLAVAGPFRPAAELATLTDVARRQPDPQHFENAINAAGAYSGDVIFVPQPTLEALYLHV